MEHDVRSSFIEPACGLLCGTRVDEPGEVRELPDVFVDHLDVRIDGTRSSLKTRMEWPDEHCVRPSDESDRAGLRLHRRCNSGEVGALVVSQLHERDVRKVSDLEPEDVPRSWIVLRDLLDSLPSVAEDD